MLLANEQQNKSTNRTGSVKSKSWPQYLRDVSSTNSLALPTNTYHKHPLIGLLLSCVSFGCSRVQWGVVLLLLPLTGRRLELLILEEVG